MMEDAEETPRWGPSSRWKVLASFAAVLVVVSVVVSMLPSSTVDKELVGDYRLHGITDEGRLCVIRNEGGGLVVQRVPDVVVDVGWDEDYVVATRRPAEQPGGELMYYYIDIAEDSGPSRDGVTGPLSKADFEIAKESLGLPEFSTSYPELR